MDEPTSLREDVAKRLARIAGHAKSLQRIWEEGRDADEVLTQVTAVRAALGQVGRVILEQQIATSVAQAVQMGRSAEAIRDLRNALDRFI
jgi:CsoR family transcriptional regulator, copper-sensing transcriptional repressor